MFAVGLTLIQVTNLKIRFDWLYLKKERIFELFYIKNVLDLTFDIQIFIELLNN